MRTAHDQGPGSAPAYAGVSGLGSPTEALAAFIVNLDYDDLPSTVVGAAKRLVLDSLGCAIGGAALVPGQITVNLFGGMGGAGESTVWATGTRLPCPQAAYVNAYLANLQDFDDTYTGAGHPGATVIQSALAVGEKVHASGCQVLTAVVVGYEIAVRIGLAIAPSAARFRLGWGGFGFQIFGAAAVASKLMGLDQLATARALGLAGISAPVPTTLAPDRHAGGRVFGWSKCDSGWKALGGILAALKASEGFVAHTSILDGDGGFWRMAGSDHCDFQRMTSGLGQEFLTLGVEHKPYPTCRWTHSSIDAIEAILESHPMVPEDIGQITVRTFSSLVRYGGITAPVDIVEAQFALPYLLALRLHGRLLTSPLSERDLSDDRILATAKKVRLECDPEAEEAFHTANENPATVIVHTNGGQSHVKAVGHGRGGKDNALTDEELQAKFLELARPIVGARCAERIKGKIEQFEQLEDLSTSIIYK